MLRTLSIACLILVALTHCFYAQSTAEQCSSLRLPDLSTYCAIAAIEDTAVRNSYVWFDSVVHDSNFYEHFEERLESMTQSDAKDVMRRIYLMSDYDPLRFAVYCAAPVPLGNGRPLGTTYCFRFLDRAADLGFGTVQSPYLCSVDAILRVRVNALQCDVDSSNIKGWCCSRVDILDAIKGQLLSAQDFRVGYNPFWSNCGSDLVPVIQDYKGRLFIKKDAMGYHALEPGKEYLVFLSARTARDSATGASISFVPIMDGNGGIYPIEDGHITDKAKHWGLGATPTLDSFLNQLRSHLAGIREAR